MTERASNPAVSSAAAPSPPERYILREDEEGRSYLTCREAPTVHLVIEDGAVSASAARNAPAGTIYLDGAAQAGPFLDTERHVHNLDHHEGCVRAFTLAACEQALVLVLKGFDLRDREWTVHANEPDLDTVLAVWVLFNHMHLSSTPEIRERLIPLVRLEGTIDAHGMELLELCGFPDELMRETRTKLDTLHQREVLLTRDGSRRRPDRMERTVALLREVDGLIYAPGDLEHDVAELEELARVELPPAGLIVACRSPESIYRVEQTLRWLYGDRLALIVLQKDETTITLRQVAPFLPATLEAAYEELNLIDPAAGHRGSSSRWGGSAEIGGSPRGRGTELTPRQIAEACARAFRGPTMAERAAALAKGVAAAALGLGGARGVWWLLQHTEARGSSVSNAASVSTADLVAVMVLLLVTLSGLALGRAHRRPGFYGLRLPSGRSWWVLLPGALLGGLLGGAAFPARVVTAFTEGGQGAGARWLLVTVAIALPLLAELLFRGLVQGELFRAVRNRGVQRSWVPRPAAALGALLYAATPVALAPLLWRSGFAASATLLVAVAGALLLGLACGMARDRSESLVPPVLFHLLAGGLVVAVVVLMT